MAARYFLNIGSNWSDTANWSDTTGGSGGFSVPTSSDDVYFDTNSANCTIDTSARAANTINFTGYVNTITFTFGLTVSGNVTLDTGMTFAGSATFTINATSTITSNSQAFDVPLTLSASTATFTLADDLTCNALLILNGSATIITINGFTIYATSGISQGAGNIIGTTDLVLQGTGTWSGIGSSLLGIDTEINSAGTITIGNVSFGGVSGVVLKYTAGTVNITTDTSLTLGTCSIDLDGITLEKIVIPSGATVITLLSDVTLAKDYSCGQNGSTVNGLFTMYIGRHFTPGTASGGTGTATIVLNGTGTWSSSSGNSVEINTTGTITFGAVLGLGTKTLTYTAGTVITAGSTFNTGATTFTNCSTIKFNNFTTSGAAVLQSDLTVLGNFSQSNNISWSGVYNVYVGGNFLQSQSFITPATFVLNGTGIWYGGGTMAGTAGNGALQINTTGTITISGTVRISGNLTLSYIKGRIKTIGATLNIVQAVTLINIHHIFFKNVNISPGITVTMNKFFNGNPYAPCRIRSTTTAKYNVILTNPKTEIAFYTHVSDANITSNNLLIATTNGNKGSNVGIKYINNLGNGLPLNSPNIKNPAMLAGVNGLLSDPAIVQTIN